MLLLGPPRTLIAGATATWPVVITTLGEVLGPDSAGVTSRTTLGRDELTRKDLLEMTSASLLRVLLVRWYITVAGLLLSLVMAAAAYTLIPVRYESSSTVVLVQPQQPGAGQSNPLLDLNQGMNTTAAIVVQAMNSRVVSGELGLVTDEDSFTVKNIGGAGINNTVDRPFVSVTAQSSSPARSTEIVGWVMDRTQRELTDLQRNLQVRKRKYVVMESVADPAPAKSIRSGQLSALAAVTLLGISMTVAFSWGYDRMISRARPDRAANRPVSTNGAPTNGAPSLVPYNDPDRREDPWSPGIATVRP
jgi:capsular polysaccharide biosynthesis protein